jgi:hypothetical protein
MRLVIISSPYSPLLGYSLVTIAHLAVEKVVPIESTYVSPFFETFAT